MSEGQTVEERGGRLSTLGYRMLVGGDGGISWETSPSPEEFQGHSADRQRVIKAHQTRRCRQVKAS